MKQVINFFREHDAIEIVMVYIPFALTALVVVGYFIYGVVGLFQ
jgi:hypothetical protein